MASKTPDSEDEKAMAEKAKQAKAAAEKTPVATKAPEMSGGLISESAPVDPVAQGAGKMAEHIEGVKPDGTYMTPEERIAAHKAAKDTRFTMQNEPTVERGLVTQGERGLVPYQGTGGGSPPPPAASAGGVAGAGASKPSLFNRAVKGLTPSPTTLGLVGANAADFLIPRANDSTDAGYNVNTARDTAMSALNTAALVPMLMKKPSPATLGAAALLGGGTALYNRLSDYNKQHPENGEGYQYKTPQADANFWEQAPAVVQDAGHLASKAIRGLGDGVAYDLENYTPYPYLRDGAQKVVDYFTPKSKHPEFKDGQKILREATQSPVSQYAPEISEVMHPNLPKNVKQEADGTYTKSIYDKEGNYLGYGQSKTPYADEATNALKQGLTPQAQAIYERQKAIMDQNLSDNPPVASVGPGGELIQTNYDKDGRIVRSSNPEVRQRVDDILRNRAIQAQAAMPEFEEGHVERFQKFRDRVKAERDLEAAKGAGITNDPIANANTARAMEDAATRLGALTGKDPMSLLPELDPRYSNSVADTAREFLRARGQGRPMTQAEAVAQNLISTPNQIGNPIQAQQQKSAIQAFAPSEKVQEVRDKAEDRDLSRELTDKNAQLAREVSQANHEQTIKAQQQSHADTKLANRLTAIDKEMANLSKTPALETINKKRIEALRGEYNRLAGLDESGIYAQPQPEADAIPKVSSQEEYDKLPVGAKYTDPNGRTLTKK